MSEASPDIAPVIALENQRCGFTALVGAPNAGKSTLMNALVGAKVSIVSPKVQTTRTRILGIAVEGDAQLVFIDTPGIFTGPKRRLERAMIDTAWRNAEEADCIALLIDAGKGIDHEIEELVTKLGARGDKLILILNKIDLVPRVNLLGLVATLQDLFAGAGHPMPEVFMISALTRSGLDDLRTALAKQAPSGPWVYPADQLADLSERLMAAEFTREQLFLQLYDELPYSVMVETDQWQEFADGSVRIDQTILVERASQKPIVIGAGGKRIKAIGAAARVDIAELIGRPVHLFLNVKIRENWLDEPARYRALGLNFNA